MSGDLEGNGSYMPEFQELPAGERLDLCKQLLDGLETMHQKGYLHGDIKPGNCLMKEGADGIPEKLVISDFGGARKGGVNPPTHTDRYRPADYREDRAKADVFAMSKTLIEVLGETQFRFPDPPGPFEKNDPFLKEMRLHLTMCGVPSSVSDVLISGLYKASERPTAQQLNDAYKVAVGSLSEKERGAINRFHFLNMGF
jgi:serine/threonine protein kinase